MATRGNSDAKLKIKVPKPVALAFVRRTLARSRKFEETGKSCFSEPALRDTMLAGQPSCKDLKNVNATRLINHSSQSGVKLRGLLDFDNGKAGGVLMRIMPKLSELNFSCVANLFTTCFRQYSEAYYHQFPMKFLCLQRSLRPRRASWQEFSLNCLP